jgi:Fe-S cluster assembly iron-binding protein IscA
MLALTSNAHEAIEGILSAASIPAGAGLRIAPPAGVDAAPGGQLQLTVAAVPAEADQVIDEEGARVFVDEEAADFLDDKVLDASIVGEEVRFAIAEQPE